MVKEVKIFNLLGFIICCFVDLFDWYYYVNCKIVIWWAVWGSGFLVIGILLYYGAYVFIII